MTGRKRLLLWLGLIVSLPAGGYTATCVVFYAWLNAADPARWPADRASMWVYASLAFTVMFLGLFIYCMVSLIKGANRQYRDEVAAREATFGPVNNSGSG